MIESPHVPEFTVTRYEESNNELLGFYTNGIQSPLVDYKYLIEGRVRMAQVNLRVTDERIAFIDRAAAIQGVTRTEFVLRSSEAAALEDETYDAFITALDAPVEPPASRNDDFTRVPE